MSAASVLRRWAVALVAPLLAATSVARVLAQALDIDDAGVHLGASVDTQPDGVQRRLTVKLRSSDSATSQPLTGLHPLAWLLPATAERASRIDCKQELSGLVKGGLASAAAVSFNGYRLLALNDDASISIINPQVNLRGTQLEALIALPSMPSDWVLDAEAHELYVALSGSDEIAVVSLAQPRVVRHIALTGHPRAARLYWDGPQRRLWAASTGPVTVLSIDPDTGHVDRVGDVGSGAPVLVPLADHHWLAVGASESAQVLVVDTLERRQVSSLSTTDGALSLAYSALSQRLYVAGQAGRVLSLPPDGRGPPTPIAELEGVGAVAITPDGHYGFALQGARDEVSSFDTATGHVTASAAVAAGAVDIQFSEQYAYLRGHSDDQVTLVALEEVRSGRLTMTTIPVGMGRSTAPPQRRSGSIVTTPETGAAIIANAAGRQLYFYTEGMMVPMGTLPAYGHAPVSLLIDDRSLAEGARGQYSATAQWSAGGDYWLLMLVDQPRLVQCARITLAGLPARPARSAPSLTIAIPAAPVLPGVPSELRVESTNGQPLPAPPMVRALHILATDGTGGWQRHLPLREAGRGDYRATVTFPEPGVYHLLLKSDHPELALGSARSQRLVVAMPRAATRELAKEKP
jgi:DNA-binding beta-propeller fold protein YncE